MPLFFTCSVFLLFILEKSELCRSLSEQNRVSKLEERQINLRNAKGNMSFQQLPKRFSWQWCQISSIFIHKPNLMNVLISSASMIQSSNNSAIAIPYTGNLDSLMQLVNISLKHNRYTKRKISHHKTKHNSLNNIVLMGNRTFPW